MSAGGSNASPWASPRATRPAGKPETARRVVAGPVVDDPTGPVHEHEGRRPTHAVAEKASAIRIEGDVRGKRLMEGGEEPVELRLVLVADGDDVDAAIAREREQLREGRGGGRAQGGAEEEQVGAAVGEGRRDVAAVALDLEARRQRADARRRRKLGEATRVRGRHQLLEHPVAAVEHLESL